MDIRTCAWTIPITIYDEQCKNTIVQDIYLFDWYDQQKHMFDHPASYPFNLKVQGMFIISSSQFRLLLFLGSNIQWIFQVPVKGGR